MTQPDTATRSRKSFFDLLRRLIGRSFRQSEVDAIDEWLDGEVSQECTDTSHGDNDGSSTQAEAADFFVQASVTCSPSVQQERSMESRRVGSEGIALIKRFEGLAKLRTDGMIAAYPDPGTGGEPWTIGWGATGPGIGPDTVWTKTQCDARLEADLQRYASDVVRALNDAPTTQNQFDALVSFHYNTGAIHRATLTRRHKAGDHDGAAHEFAKWKYAGGRVMNGLVRRRMEEAKLYRRK